MRQGHYSVTRHDIHRHTLDRLTTHLRLPDHSRWCPATVVFQVVLAAPAHRLATAPPDQTIRTALPVTGGEPTSSPA